ncbi:Protein-methionine-sulfoxide reductase catalytic subunit MsrP [Nocardioides aquaticus]|uniref:Protein-methionine-sulfoxide reductase catalytic subunit MsrP n=1 Tax=Nocardioides aquaticus TaxID=160826 RepID=A0ABX8EPF3_9ACTN|nr:molybdopterin-dependent oxidoreductase [Nocardioides aquaticus]QVT81910.1 Protein-methionine-sulfoxide reductase catalytic subunit MsrP [Nocardioides aquaticus]
MRSRSAYAAFGVLATLVGMGAGHLVAAFTSPASSPVLAVGSAVIDRTPVPLAQWAIRTFGTADKAVLIGSVMLGVLLLAGLAGVLARRRFVVGAAVLVVLVVVAAAAALTNAGAGALDVVPALATAVAGVAALALLDRLARRARPARTTDATTSASSGVGRRGVLLGAGSMVVLAAALAGAGRLVGRLRSAPADVTLPAAAQPLPALPTGLEETYPGISPLQVPNEDFYRVDTRLDVPIVDVDDWTLTIDGDVDQEVVLTFDDIAAMELVERDITLTCVSNSVGGEFVGGARWLGVPLMSLLKMAGIENTKADQLFSTDVDGMTISTPLALATDGRDAMLAIGMNGEPLPREHGFPARMVIPGLYGFISATKWIERITLTTYAEQESYWTERDWATDAPIKPSARIDTPQALPETVAPGEVVVGGVAWAQTQGGVAKIEVAIDGGDWQQAELGPEVDNDYWRQWFYRWDATPGLHSVAARVTDGEGDLQSTKEAPPFPSGSSGIHLLQISVSD